jgi:hypothetical protein
MKKYIVNIVVLLLILALILLINVFRNKKQTLYGAIASDNIDNIRTIISKTSIQEISQSDNLLRITFERYVKGKRDAIVTKRDTIEYRNRTDEIVKLLVDKGIDIDKPENGIPPLYWAVKYEYDELSELMIKHGAKVDVFFDDDTPLIYGIALVNERWIPILIQNKANINIKNKQGNTPLHLAILNRNSTDVIKVLLENGADMTIVNNANESPLSIETRRSNIKGEASQVLQLMRKYKGTVNDRQE